MEQDSHKQRVQKQFGRSAGDYATSNVHAMGESLTELVNLTSPSSEWKVLDVATGAGHTALAFAPHVSEVIATDITQGMLDQCMALANERSISNLRVEMADAEQLPFENESFDMVTCRLAFHHFLNPELALAEFCRVLKPTGVFGFTDNYTVDDPSAARYYNRYEKIRDPSHHWVGALPEIRRKFEDAGFSIGETRTLEKEFEFHAWADRQRVSDSDKKILLQMMREIPAELKPLMKPRFADNSMYFHLAEVVMIASKVVAAD